jgi:hypothetical protein
VVVVLIILAVVCRSPKDDSDNSRPPGSNWGQSTLSQSTSSFPAPLARSPPDYGTIRNPPVIRPRPGSNWGQDTLPQPTSSSPAPRAHFPPGYGPSISNPPIIRPRPGPNWVQGTLPHSTSTSPAPLAPFPPGYGPISNPPAIRPHTQPRTWLAVDRPPTYSDFSSPISDGWSSDVGTPTLIIPRQEDWAKDDPPLSSVCQFMQLPLKTSMLSGYITCASSRRRQAHAGFV